MVQCLDVEKCAEAGPEKGKYALVLTHFGVPNEGMLQSIKSMSAAAEAAGNADMLMIMMEKDANRMSAKVKKLMAKWDVKLHVVPWDVPPDAKHYPKHDWCGHQDLIRLHVLALEPYDAVAYYDGDCEFQGDILPVLKCAASGKFLSTNGGVGEALNIGFIALRPDKRLLEAARIFARENAFTQVGGWGDSGWKPNGGYYVGGECGQGFFYTLFYKKSEAARKALQAAGVWENGVFDPAQIDRCIWNYQTSYQCKPDFNCERVRVHHKPTRERGTDKNECEKLKFRERRKELLKRKKMQRKPPTAEELALAQEGFLLRHQAGLCVRPADEVFKREDDTVLVLQDCATLPVEQNIRVVEFIDDEEDEEFLRGVRLKSSGYCAHPEDNEDPDLAPKEPKIAFPADCSSQKHEFVFKRLKSKTQEGKFLLKHPSGRCVHPFEGQESPKENTELILHSDCTLDRKALQFVADKANAPAPSLPMEVSKQTQPEAAEVARKKEKAKLMPAPLEEPCEYMAGNPQSSRPGKPCLPPATFWPYKSRTDWRVEYGKRILDAVTPKVKKAECNGFHLYGDVCWCNKAFDQGVAPALLGLSYGIEERDIWSELISARKLRTKLYDCFIPPERSTPISGKAPNGTRKCDGVESKPCYTTKYESYRICLGSEEKKQEGRRFETLLPHLKGLPPLSVHLKIDTEGSEWAVLDQLMKSPEDWDKIRTLDMEVHFGWNNAGNPDHVKNLPPKERLGIEVEIMERLLEKFHCTGSTLEVYRQGWNPKDNCKGGTCNEPPVYLPGGFSVEMFAVSYVNKELLK